MAAELGPLARVRAPGPGTGPPPVYSNGGLARSDGGPAQQELNGPFHSYSTCSVTCEVVAPSVAAAPSLLISLFFHSSSRSAHAFGRRWSAATAARRVFHKSSVMLFSVRTRLACRTLLKGSIENTSSRRSSKPLPKTGTEDLVPSGAGLKNRVSDSRNKWLIGSATMQ